MDSLLFAKGPQMGNKMFVQLFNVKNIHFGAWILCLASARLSRLQWRGWWPGTFPEAPGALAGPGPVPGMLGVSTGEPPAPVLGACPCVWCWGCRARHSLQWGCRRLWPTFCSSLPASWAPESSSSGAGVRFELPRADSGQLVAVRLTPGDPPQAAPRSGGVRSWLTGHCRTWGHSTERAPPGTASGR